MLLSTASEAGLAFAALEKASLFFPGGDTPFAALREITLELKPGDHLAILGQNGAGKTSLCRCLTGQYLPQRGKVRLRGRAQMLSQALVGGFPELSGRENAAVVGELLFTGSSKARRALAEECVEFSELGEHIDRPLRTYSPGMRARLLLALMTAQPVDLLVVDEAFDGADLFFRRKLQPRILGALKAAGASVLVSHSLDPLEILCNRAVVLSEGRITFEGAPADAVKFYLRHERGQA